MTAMKIVERSMFEYCPCLEEPVDDCYCTKPGSENIEKMLHFCCRNFYSCEIYHTKFH
jgi:hypothetical protein